MKPLSETGHVKNVSNFDQLIHYCTGYGEKYNPSRTICTLASLSDISARSWTAIDEVNNMNSQLKAASAIRKGAFRPISKLTTRLINALKASGASHAICNNARSIANKIQGKRATPKLTEEEIKELAAEGIEKKEISASQMSFDNQIDNFDKLNKLLSIEPLYAPNEPELTTASLTELIIDLRSKNSAAILATINLENARNVRDNILYTKANGLVDVAASVKYYVKSVFGSSSIEYKQISALRFIQRK